MKIMIQLRNTVSRRLWVFAIKTIGNVGWGASINLFDEENKLADLKEFKQKVYLGKPTDDFGCRF